LRHLGLDIGEVRTGVAVSDPSGTVASPVAVLDSRELSRDPKQLLRLVDEYCAKHVVIGLPLTMRGEEGPQARLVREAGTRLEGWLDIPVSYWDERLSTAEAARVLSEGGVRSIRQRRERDKLAATILLQSYLDASASRAKGAEDE
jgi:putative Holliday junction resolvase